MKLGAVVPVDDHGLPVAGVVRALRVQGLPLLLVDDGTELGCATALDRLATEDGIALLRLPEKQGKGSAVMAGLRRGWALVWTGTPAQTVNQPMRVRHPKGGISHFRTWRDNVRISAVHARLFFSMLCRASLLRRRWAG
jgi:hypothetical protein